MLYLFVLGLFVGILVVNVGHDMWVSNSSLLESEMLAKIEASTPESGSLFLYILKHRLFTLCMLSLLATTVFGISVMCCYICYMGLAAGCLLSVASARYGIKGLVLITAGIFPQGIFFIPGYIALCLWVYGVNRRLYAKNTFQGDPDRYSRQFYLKKGLQMLGILILFLAGCLIESYVNPKILHLALKIF
jgi:stage II sporulation protein M